MPTPDPKTLAAARALLRKGDVDGAVREFLEASAFEDAARALASANRAVEAAELLLESLGVPSNELSRLRDAQLRARATQAAALLRQSGFVHAADDIANQIGGAPQRASEKDPEEETILSPRRGPPQDEKTQIAKRELRTDTSMQVMPDAPETRPHMAVAPKQPARRPSPLENAPREHIEDQPTRPPMRNALASSQPPRRISRVVPTEPDADSDSDSTQPPTDAPPRQKSSGAVKVVIDAGFEQGARIAERYELGPLIGRGGMARVFRAQDLELGQEIAIKVFDRMDDATLLARFKQELLSSRQIAHVNVVRLFDIGTHGEQKYLTMELLVGQDLKERLVQPIAVSESLDLLIQLCRGLEAAHSVGVIHRDIKPQNIFITTQRVVKIMDFGIAKLQAAAKLTSPGMGVGTPEFMAPEQILDSSKVSPATDLYSVGVTAYRMCTGRVPFSDRDMLKLLKMQLREDPTPPRKINPRLPPQLEALILRLMAKVPAARIQSAGEVAEAFATIRKMFGSQAGPAH